MSDDNLPWGFATALRLAAFLAVIGGAILGVYWLESWSGAVLGASGGLVVVLVLLYAAASLRADAEVSQQLGQGFRLSLRSHGILAQLIGLVCAGVGCLLLSRFLDALAESWWLRLLLLLAALMVGFLVPRSLVRVLTPARCPECAGRAYYHGTVRTEGERAGSLWATEFTCRGCGKVSRW